MGLLSCERDVFGHSPRNEFLMARHHVSPATTIVLYLVNGLLALILVSHFTLVAFSMLPANPLNHQYKYQLFRYVNPFFSQAWTLFSPNPINSNQRLLFKYDIYSRGNKHSTPWVDVVAPMTSAKKSSYWSPVQRILKHISSSTNQTSEARNKALKFVAEHDSLRNDPVKAQRFVRRVVESSPGHKALIEYSYYTYKRLMTTAKQAPRPDSVQVTYLISSQEFPRFSKRKQDYFDVRNSNYTHLSSFACALKVNKL